jgi:hypothetical protein
MSTSRSTFANRPLGELAFWPMGDEFCMLLGATPVS